jgi:hypothetical protein
MKNIHVLPTDNTSRLHLGKSGLVLCDFVFDKSTINGQHIYITSDEEIKEDDWCIVDGGLGRIGIDKVQTTIRYSVQPKKIILTTDQELIKDGVQAIDDEFLEWYVKNPSCEFVKIEKYFHEVGDTFDYEIIIPQQETELEKAVEKYANSWEARCPCRN